MKQKSSQMRFAPWLVVQAALALALSGLLLAQPQAAAQGFAAGLQLCGDSLLPALFPLFVVCGLLGPLAPALGWPLRPLMRLCGIRSPRAPAVLVLGWCGGYAVCAQQIAALRKTGELPPRDAALLLLLGCCSGPGFVVGCIGGQLFGSVALGLLLYGLTTVESPLRHAVYQMVLDARDEEGIWAEYYADGKPAGMRWRVWEGGVNLMALLTYEAMERRIQDEAMA